MVWEVDYTAATVPNSLIIFCRISVGLKLATFSLFHVFVFVFFFFFFFLPLFPFYSRAYGVVEIFCLLTFLN
jgi:hypothetical protein